MDRSGLLVSGVVAERRTRGHSFSGMSSRGVEGKLLVLDTVEPLAERLG